MQNQWYAYHGGPYHPHQLPPPPPPPPTHFPPQQFSPPHSLPMQQLHHPPPRYFFEPMPMPTPMMMPPMRSNILQNVVPHMQQYRPEPVALPPQQPTYMARSYPDIVLNRLPKRASEEFIVPDGSSDSIVEVEEKEYESEEVSDDANNARPVSTTRSYSTDKPGRIFRCENPRCTKVYKNQNGLTYHQRLGQCVFAADGQTAEESEAMNKPFVCPVAFCNKRYKNNNGLRYHIKHTPNHHALLEEDPHLRSLVQSKSSNNTTATTLLTPDYAAGPPVSPQPQLATSLPNLGAFGMLAFAAEQEAKSSHTENPVEPWAEEVPQQPAQSSESDVAMEESPEEEDIDGTNDASQQSYSPHSAASMEGELSDDHDCSVTIPHTPVIDQVSEQNSQFKPYHQLQDRISYFNLHHPTVVESTPSTPGSERLNNAQILMSLGTHNASLSLQEAL